MEMGVLRLANKRFADEKNEELEKVLKSVETRLFKLMGGQSNPVHDALANVRAIFKREWINANKSAILDRMLERLAEE